ncbi:hypothetical protein [Streptomyces sp. NPDC048462]|uniref:hypothetical protein n=1 Tax=Streptomyces sp. NPDC048462 TaxID=3365555 RepID=UPI00371CD2A8
MAPVTPNSEADPRATAPVTPNIGPDPRGEQIQLVSAPAGATAGGSRRRRTHRRIRYEPCRRPQRAQPRRLTSHQEMLDLLGNRAKDGGPGRHGAGMDDLRHDMTNDHTPGQQLTKEAIGR